MYCFIKGVSFLVCFATVFFVYVFTFAKITYLFAFQKRQKPKKMKSSRIGANLFF
ncbi:Hypothetical protein Ccan_19320 [Capnocytophaga canimorsus Cc5]|uniref:Uncharacterized protein n=1 Tax=Capnocytophaga canimorsus (strain 5) TaxID=860228 RepID=F9YTC9_CAPCC|nr:Hypothetical protein Ccan_19320 [Capnocytophaga canimorsus Cc5]